MSWKKGREKKRLERKRSFKQELKFDRHFVVGMCCIWGCMNTSRGRKDPPRLRRCGCAALITACYLQTSRNAIFLIRLAKRGDIACAVHADIADGGSLKAGGTLRMEGVFLMAK